MRAIPHCDELFHAYFAPWYGDDDLSARGFDATRPDMMQLADYAGTSAADLSLLHHDDQKRFVHQFAITMADAAANDFGRLLELPPPVDINWIQAIDDYYNVNRIADLIDKSDVTDDGNAYFITCIELGTLIAKVMKSLAPELDWIAESPYWESSLWHSPSGYIIPPTHWAIKKLSDYGWDDGLVPKIHCGIHALQSASDAT